jgi:DNA-nicking Smr family endonuclease
MSGRTPTRREIADEDRRLWQAFTRGIRPLRGVDPPPAPQPRASATPAAPTPIAPVAMPVFGAAATSPPLAPGIAAGVDRRTLDRLRRGQIPPEAQIDLHLKTQAQAHAELTTFLARAQTAGRRCVLVITGKGFGADGRVGVLKTEVPRWLNEPANRARLLAFCHATPPLGGEGALFVLLRRVRPSR